MLGLGDLSILNRNQIFQSKKSEKKENQKIDFPLACFRAACLATMVLIPPCEAYFVCMFVFHFNLVTSCTSFPVQKFLQK